MLIILFDIRGVVHKEFILAGHTDNSAYYCDVLRRRLRPVASRQCTHTFFYIREFFMKSNMADVPHPPYFLLFTRLKTKLKGRHFDTIEVIETESLGVLKTLTEHNFYDILKIGRSTGNGAYAQKGTTSRVMVASRPNVDF
jgi:hypothetical protein